jgi:thiosulfate reductase cytochrome b subunit
MTAEVVEKSSATAVLKTRSGRELIYRHALFIRLSHWLNVLCIAILLMSGLQIFNAHSNLYWGNTGNEGDPAIFSIYGEDQLEGPPIGWLQIGSLKINTTGWLGIFRDADGFFSGRAFPYWITLPSYQSLAEGRRWHFFFAWLFALNGLAYLIYGIIARHFRRDIKPTRTDFARFGRVILDHLTFKRARGEEAKHYNVIQKLTYIVVSSYLADDDRHRPVDVAGYEFRGAVAAGTVRRTAIGAHGALHQRKPDRSLRHHSRREVFIAGVSTKCAR